MTRSSKAGKIAVVLLSMLSGAGVFAQASAPVVGSPPMPVQTLAVMPLSGGAYWVSGGISNTGFIIGTSGVIVIDAQTFLPAARTVLADIARLTPKPVNAIILTHSDPDHINGLPAFPRGIEIIAQDNAKRDIERVITDPRSNGLPPAPEIKDYVPTHTVGASEQLTLDGVLLSLIHTGPAHTDGDLIVYVPAQKLVYAGDLLAPAVGPYPGIHLAKNGSSLGWIRSIEAMLALDADRFVTGHGGVMTRAEVEDRLHVGERRRAEIKAMVDRHMTLTEVQTALHDARLPGLASRFPTFVETTYAELTGDGRPDVGSK